jgi:TonB family protein
MNSLLNFFIEANLYLICFYLLYQILLAGDKHFWFNRAFLLGGITLSLLLPMLSININPSMESANAFEGYLMLPAITITEVRTESVGFILKWWQIIGIVYLAGMVFYLFRLLWQMAHIMRHLPLFNSAREKKNGYTLVTTNGEIPTCSFFKFLFWDKSAQLNPDEQKQVFEHELAHIRQWHSIDVLLIELLRAVFWFNPVIHLLKSRITEVHEFLADSQATRKISVEDYSRLLTLQIFKNFDFALSNNFHKSQVLKRIRMLKNTSSKSIWLNVGLLIPAMSLLIFILSCDVSNQNEAMVISNPEVETELSQQTISLPESKEIFTIVENQPTPIGGMADFYEYIQQNLKYPEQARNLGIEGKVFVEFIVGSDGKLTHVKAVKGIGGGCDQEAVRVISNSQKWQPGLQRGEAVNVRMILPITFKLG